MGDLLDTFTGDHIKANGFLGKVKRYLNLNFDASGFNSPIKKVTLTLTLIKGENIEGWTRSMDNLISSLDLV
jgi:hypothetical protein